jgi:hypothetical protein
VTVCGVRGASLSLCGHRCQVAAVRTAAPAVKRGRKRGGRWPFRVSGPCRVSCRRLADSLKHNITPQLSWQNTMTQYK